MSTFLYILLGLLMFGVIIFIHELGHFLCAKAFHVAIEEFAIGMGPKLLSHVGKDGVCYSLRAVPIGGFVSMVGEDEDSDTPGANSCAPAMSWHFFTKLSRSPENSLRTSTVSAPSCLR